jgi:electron transfer flavoprotein beta subunit
VLNIVVCVKQVPDTTAEKRLTGEMYLDRSAAEPVLNPFDEYAVEEALQIRDRVGGEVTALCMGPASAKETVRKAVAMGANRAVLLSDPALAGSDTWGTAYALAMALRKLGFDLALFGMQSTDAGTGQVPGAVAEFLGLPQLTLASKLDVDGDRVIARRETETGYQRLAAKLPAVVSVVKGINEPRYPALKGIMTAKRADIPVWSCGDVDIDASKVGRAGAMTRVLSATPAKPKTAGPVITDDGTGARQIVEFLVQKKVL